mmetsp:Transcript_1562/g.2309  ORF Transcript_1562/g.2309 Transcript_1562/m.2309 type:complete len:106 (+) Transcript_1562:832-1149(+)
MMDALLMMCLNPQTTITMVVTMVIVMRRRAIKIVQMTSKTTIYAAIVGAEPNLQHSTGLLQGLNEFRTHHSRSDVAISASFARFDVYNYTCARLRNAPTCSHRSI